MLCGAHGWSGTVGAAGRGGDRSRRPPPPTWALVQPEPPRVDPQLQSPVTRHAERTPPSGASTSTSHAPTAADRCLAPNLDLVPVKLADAEHHPLQVCPLLDLLSSAAASLDTVLLSSPAPSSARTSPPMSPLLDSYADSPRPHKIDSNAGVKRTADDAGIGGEVEAERRRKVELLRSLGAAFNLGQQWMSMSACAGFLPKFVPEAPTERTKDRIFVQLPPLSSVVHLSGI